MSSAGLLGDSYAVTPNNTDLFSSNYVHSVQVKGNYDHKLDCDIVDRCLWLFMVGHISCVRERGKHATMMADLSFYIFTDSM
jgi:hypothetical protein